jgi:hypothetical protein
MSQRRGRPRKNTEVVETHFSEESHAILVVEEILIRAIRLEPAGESICEGRSRKRKVDIT